MGGRSLSSEKDILEGRRRGSILKDIGMWTTPVLGASNLEEAHIGGGGREERASTISLALNVLHLHYPKSASNWNWTLIHGMLIDVCSFF